MTLKTALAKFNFFLFGILSMILLTNCREGAGTGQSISQPKEKDILITKFDTLIRDLVDEYEMMTEDLIEFGIIDTTYKLSETCYVDTTVRLNDSIIYSIISAGDQAAICSHLYIATLNQKSQKIIDSKYLYADCDIDYSIDSYELYEHELNSANKIRLTRSTIFQKKEKKSFNEDDNIDHKEIHHDYLIISPTGKINSSSK